MGVGRLHHIRILTRTNFDRPCMSYGIEILRIFGVIRAVA